MSYICLMLLGCGGVGKTCLLCGLKNEPCPEIANSTLLADLQTLKSLLINRLPGATWTSASQQKFCTVKTDEDEYIEMAHLIRLVFDAFPEGKNLPKNRHDDGPSMCRHPEVKAILDKVLSLAHEIESPRPKSDTWMRVWDCGGQRFFRTILPAFLSSKAMFLLMFDARQDLNCKCTSSSNYQGKSTTQMEDVTNLQLLHQWMASVHSRMIKDARSSVEIAHNRACSTPIVKQSTSRDAVAGVRPSVSELSSSNSETLISMQYRIFPVGTHGDDPNVKRNAKQILAAISQACKGKAYEEMVHEGVIVDNTTAGAGEDEDPTYGTIREWISSFAEGLNIPTPITWVLFRMVLNRLSKSKPVISLDVVEDVALACFIPKEDVGSVLHFYHGLAVHFHYSHIPSLRDRVIANPQWLVRIIADLFPLEGSEDGSDIQPCLWALLREKGILVQGLYDQILSKQEFLQSEAILDLLEDFLILARIYTSSNTVHHFQGREYFVPSMLKPAADNEEDQALGTSTVHMKQAETYTLASLHLIFSTDYLPPGFFIRFAALLSKNGNCEVLFDQIYSNKISYEYGSRNQCIDQLVIAEKIGSIQIDVERVMPREDQYSTLLSTFQELVKLLKSCSMEVLQWLPGISMDLAFQCAECGNHKPEHFVLLPSGPLSSEPVLRCQQNQICRLNSTQKFWLDIQYVRYLLRCCNELQ